MTLRNDDPVASPLVEAIRVGDVTTLARLLGDNPGLAAARIQGDNGVSRTLLHVAADWPGYFPNGPRIVDLLVNAGAAPNARVMGSQAAETPLHWAASSDDAEVAVALIDRGADIEASGASIAGGTPLDDAVGYGCWHVARILVQRGARVDKLWHAAALGLQPRVEELLAVRPSRTPDEITAAFWQACHGGQRRTAEFLLTQGADLNGIPGYAERTPLDIAGSLDTRRDLLVAWLRDHDATSAST